MIKGIYNENEFYTNFYWDTKLLEDMRSKAPAGIEEKINQLKALDSLFWKLKDSVSSHGANQGQQIEFYNLLFQILGFQPVQESTQTSESGHYTRFLNENKDSNPELIGILTSEIETGSFETAPLYLSDKIEGEQSIFELDLKELLREELLDSQAPPRWVLVGSPNSLFIIERTKWALGRYIRIEWQEVFLQRDSKPYELLLGLCSKSALCPDSGSSSHDEFDDNSHRHAFEVTTELRESVREAIEALINELIDLRKESHQKIYAKESSDLYAKELTHDALYYVYRLLFLLYLEAQGEDSDLLPLKSEIYRNGYSLEKLLELDFIEVAPDSPEAKGTFIFESLEQIFNLIFYGFEPGVKDGLLKSDLSATGFLVKGIKSDLFDPNAMKHLKGVKLSNGALLDILKKLSLTRKKERGNKPRSRVSYANLGINQLGAVYEGLLSYTGFFAQEDLHALKPKGISQNEIDSGKELDSVFLAPKSLVDKYRHSRNENYKLKDANFVLDIDGNPKIYKKGSFIYRLAGRDRQRLASYYTPESLTRSTVKYSLKVLFETKRTIEELWEVKILEPAMGSGAFLNESVNQLSEKILQLEVLAGMGDLKSPQSKKKRLWSIKYKLISENIYGVDLNPMAVELARFSLWLNCIGAGQVPPSFEGRLKIGNSLVGADLKKNADGYYQWYYPEVDGGAFLKKLKDYDQDSAKALEEYKKAFRQSIVLTDSQILESLNSLTQQIIEQMKANSSDYPSLSGRLSLCMDYWATFFFLDSKTAAAFPKNHSSYCADLVKILEGESISADRLVAINEAKSVHRFFHWDIEFFSVRSAGGFDLILGNPPWVSVEWEEALYISDQNPIPAILEMSASEVRAFISSEFSEDSRKNIGFTYLNVAGYVRSLERPQFQLMRGLSKNTYKYFVLLSSQLISENGVVGLIHEDGVYEEGNATALRALLFKRLRYHFTFYNQKKLFEIGNARQYSINISTGGAADGDIEFIHIGTLFSPQTICASIEHLGAGPVPLIKDEHGEWNTRGHKSRLIVVDSKLLSEWARVIFDDSGTPPLPNIYSTSLRNVISKLAENSIPIKELLGDLTSVGGGLIDETSGVREGILNKKNEIATDIKSVVFSGPNIGVNCLFWQETKNPYENHRSYQRIDIQRIGPNFVPRTLYSIADEVKLENEIRSYKLLGKSYREYFRLCMRRRLDPVSQRCFYSGVLPPGPIHINLVESIGGFDEFYVFLFAGFFSSIVFEALARLKNMKDCYVNDILAMPIGSNKKFFDEIAARAFVLNYSGSSFSNLLPTFNSRVSSLDPTTAAELQNDFQVLSSDGFIRDENRRNTIQSKIDVLVASTYGLSIEELIEIYHVLLPVLAQTDRKNEFNREAMLKAASTGNTSQVGTT